MDATVGSDMGGMATIERLRNLDPNVTAIIFQRFTQTKQRWRNFSVTAFERRFRSHLLATSWRVFSNARSKRAKRNSSYLVRIDNEQQTRLAFARFV